MNPKFQNPINLKILLLGFFLLFILFFTLRSHLSYFPSPKPKIDLNLPLKETKATPTPSCTKIPPSLADTIIYYSTSNTTPQQTFKEISITAQVLKKKSPCNFLVFGLGHDSLMWSALNHGGRTVFFEEDKAWINTMQQKFPTFESYHVNYDTKVSQADELMQLGRLPECKIVRDMRVSICRLALKELPSVFYEVEWDLIMVDAPTGYIPEAPGRMSVIYTAGMAARERRKEGETDVFVHDVNRHVEDEFSKEFLCEGYLKQQEGLLRHFTIPSHRADHSLPFCP